jgi:hemerythrin superfamily protein
MPTHDAIALLKEDHRTVKKLFKDFFATGARAYATRRRIADKVILELSIHSGIEETVLYPRTRAVLPQLDNEVLEALEEHHVVKTTCAELQRMNPRDERFPAKMQVLMENVRHHIAEEEQDLFAKIRKAFSRDELVAMGDDLRAAKAVMPTRPHPHAPDQPPANIAAAALTAPVDAAVNAVGTVVRRSREAVAEAVGGNSSR